MKKIANFLIIFFIFAAPLIAFALSLVPCGTSENPKPCTIACFYAMIDRIINFILWSIATPLAATALMVAGIMFLLGSSEKAVTRGRAILQYTLLGLFFAFAAWLIIDLILGNLLSPGYLPWNKFPGNC